MSAGGAGDAAGADPTPEGDTVAGHRSGAVSTGRALAEGAPDPLAAEVVGLLRARGETVATAESLTAGAVGALLAGVPGASAVLRGGLIVYATELKHSLAGVSADLLAEHGAVHPDVAAQLASGARDRCGATWGLGLTGVAGPDPQDGVPPGVVHIGVAGVSPVGGPSVEVSSVTLSGDRHRVRVASVITALELLRARLLVPVG
ncbi:CinA family protein [Actinosynnema mirum]|uniref:CinA domain protein n=1 Tax=Actinosynnema mirum (strain ATCC 29888 / DSM 43827 / JCM 3225 / NBRC 14064 / NCIMB 13271 / NRRL B-12336 / IMRU 3971 / 101) TaxID=446462 RepID=C6WDH4_ACTMD|nr:CinA domain protein [Actinosynnema mirum DSM 43827]